MGHERGFRRNRGNCRGPTPIHRSINHSRSYLPSYLIVSPFFIFFSSFFFFFFTASFSLWGGPRTYPWFLRFSNSFYRASGFFSPFFSPPSSFLSSPEIAIARIIHFFIGKGFLSLSPCDSSIRFIRWKSFRGSVKILMIERHENVFNRFLLQFSTFHSSIKIDDSSGRKKSSFLFFSLSLSQSPLISASTVKST